MVLNDLLVIHDRCDPDSDVTKCSWLIPVHHLTYGEACEYPRIRWCPRCAPREQMTALAVNWLLSLKAGIKERTLLPIIG